MSSQFTTTAMLGFEEGKFEAITAQAQVRPAMALHHCCLCWFYGVLTPWCTAGVRMPQTSLGGGINNDQLALLGLLGKQVPQAQQSNLGITPQQQAALLNALQVRI